MKKADRSNRVHVVNQIINEISVRGRKFFHYNGKTAEIIDKGRIYYKTEYGSKEFVCLSIPPYRQPKGWYHGGTLLHLVKEFRDFIKVGEVKDHSALYSPHWGYPEEDMLAIRNKAKELGYMN